MALNAGDLGAAWQVLQASARVLSKKPGLLAQAQLPMVIALTCRQRRKAASATLIAAARRELPSLTSTCKLCRCLLLLASRRCLPRMLSGRPAMTAA